MTDTKVSNLNDKVLLKFTDDHPGCASCHLGAIENVTLGMKFGLYHPWLAAGHRSPQVDHSSPISQHVQGERLVVRQCHWCVSC